MRQLRDDRKITCLEAFVELTSGLVKKLDQVNGLDIQLDVAGADLRCLDQVLCQLLQPLRLIVENTDIMTRILVFKIFAF